MLAPNASGAIDPERSSNDWAVTNPCVSVIIALADQVV